MDQLRVDAVSVDDSSARRPQMERALSDGGEPTPEGVNSQCPPPGFSQRALPDAENLTRCLNEGSRTPLRV